MTMIKEKNPLTEEMYSRIINTLLDSFNGSKEMIKDSRHVALILELSASLGLRISEILSLSFADFKYDDGKDIAYETILETLQANNKLLEAIREALAKEKNSNK